MNGKDVRRGDFLDLLEAILEAATDSAQLGDALTQALGQEFRQPGFCLAAALESLRRQRVGQEGDARAVAARPVKIAAGEERYFRATVEVFIAAEGEGEACDLMTVLLTENGVYGPDGMLRDWRYLADPWEVVGVPPEATGREEYFSAGEPPAIVHSGAEPPVIRQLGLATDEPPVSALTKFAVFCVGLGGVLTFFLFVAGHSLPLEAQHLVAWSIAIALCLGGSICFWKSLTLSAVEDAKRAVLTGSCRAAIEAGLTRAAVGGEALHPRGR